MTIEAPQTDIPIFLNHGKDIVGRITLYNLGLKIVKNTGIKSIYIASMSNKGVITFDGIGGPPIKKGGFRGPRKEEFTKKYITDRKDEIVNLNRFEDTVWNPDAFSDGPEPDFEVMLGKKIPKLQSEGFVTNKKAIGIVDGCNPLSEEQFKKYTKNPPPEPIFSNLSDKQKDAFNSSMDELFALGKAKRIHLVASLMLTIGHVYLPEGYEAQFWNDCESNELHVKLTNYFDAEEEFVVSILTLDDNLNSKFVKKGTEFYRMFPAVENMMKEITAKMNCRITTLDDAKKLPLIKSIKRTIDIRHLPEGYTSKVWRDKSQFNIHVKIENKFNDSCEFSASVMTLDFFGEPIFIKKGSEYYRLFPSIKDLMKEVIAKIESKRDDSK